MNKKESSRDYVIKRIINHTLQNLMSLVHLGF